MKKIMFCGGGSAGHVMPNVALMRALKERFDVAYMGTDGIEKDIIRAEGYEFFTFSAPKLVRGKILKNLDIIPRLNVAVRACKAILKEQEPCLLFCKGGYASLPPALAAKKLKIPVMTHESDLSPGLANRIISRFATATLTSFPETAQKFARGIYCGPPLREEAIKGSRARAMEKFGMDARKTVLVFGGGSGSKKINEAVRAAAPQICRELNILHVCGRGNITACDVKGYFQFEYIKDMGLAYACADVAVARAGSNSAFELIVNKIPTLFIPLENGASRGDQVKNAEYFEREGLCRILRENQLSAESIKEEIFRTEKDTKLINNLNKSQIKCGNNSIIAAIENAVLLNKNNQKHV